MTGVVTFAVAGQSDRRVSSVDPLPVASGGSGATADQIQGNVANGVADSGNPVKIGGRGTDSPTAVAEGQRVNQWYGRSGQAVVSVGGAQAIADGATTVTIPISTDGNGRPVSAACLIYNGTNLVYQRGDANGTFTLSKGSASIATNQVAVGTSATQVVPARAGRSAVTIVSTSAVVFYVGAAGVTAATGQYVAAAAGASITIPTSAAVFAVGASALTVSYMETF